MATIPPLLPHLTRLTVTQGQVRVSAGPKVELGTVLGSCVATCLYDPAAELGGMNHFLLAEPPGSEGTGEADEHYGVYLMELLINEMLNHGASKSRLRAHLYGGANLRAGMAAIGTANAAFARTLLRRERIAVLHEDLGGSCARRVEFRPASGRARCRTIDNTLVTHAKPYVPARPTGDVELF